jgi:hypothetical protein
VAAADHHLSATTTHNRWRHGPSKVLLLIIIIIDAELVTFLLAQRML